MALSVPNATAIVQATTFDFWNIDSQPERRKIAETYFAPRVNAYPPVGPVAVGYDALDETWHGLHSEGRENWKFAADGDMWLNDNMIQQAWTFGEGPGQWKGWDIIVVGKDGEGRDVLGTGPGSQYPRSLVHDLSCLSKQGINIEIS